MCAHVLLARLHTLEIQKGCLGLRSLSAIQALNSIVEKVEQRREHSLTRQNLSSAQAVGVRSSCPVVLGGYDRQFDLHQTTVQSGRVAH